MTYQAAGFIIDLQYWSLGVQRDGTMRVAMKTVLQCVCNTLK